MHPHLPSSTSVNTSFVQRDRDRQRECEQRRQQALSNQANHLPINNVILHTNAEKSIVFPDPVRLEQEDLTSKEIKSTLGEFGMLMPFLKHHSLNYSAEINSNLVGISRNEINRRKVNEILNEMTQSIPPKPVTSLDDLSDDKTFGSNSETEAKISRIASSNLSSVSYSSSRQDISAKNDLSSMECSNRTSLESQNSTNQSTRFKRATIDQSENCKSSFQAVKSGHLSLSSSEKDSSDEETDNEASSNESESSDEDIDSQSDSDCKLKKNLTKKSNDSPNAFNSSSEQKKKNSSNFFVPRPAFNSNTKEDEEHKWDLDNFLPAETLGSKTNLNRKSSDSESSNSSISDRFVKKDKLSSSKQNQYQYKEEKIFKTNPKKNRRIVESKNFKNQNSQKLDVPKYSKNEFGKNLDDTNQNYCDENLNESNPPIRKPQSIKNEESIDSSDRKDLHENGVEMFDNRIQPKINRSKFLDTKNSRIVDNSLLLYSDLQIQDKDSSIESSKNLLHRNRKSTKTDSIPSVNDKTLQSIQKFENKRFDPSNSSPTKLCKKIENGSRKNKSHKKNDDCWSDSNKSRDPKFKDPKLEKINQNQLIDSKISVKNFPKSNTSEELTPKKNIKIDSSTLNLKKEILNNSNEEQKKIELVNNSSDSTLGSFNVDQPNQSLIVSIELPKLNRVPVITNGDNEHSNYDSRTKSEFVPLNKLKNTKTLSNSDEKYASLKINSFATANRSRLKTNSKSRDGTISRKTPVHTSTRSASQITSTSVSPAQTTSFSKNSLSNSVQDIRYPLCQNEQEASSMARMFKHKADSIQDPQLQILQYIEASLYFIQAGLFIEQKKTDSDIEKAFLLYSETLKLINVTTSKLTKNKPLLEQNTIDLELTVLSFQCQALLNTRLARMKAREFHSNKEIINQFYKSNEEISENSINVSESTLVPNQILSLIKRQLLLFKFSYSSNDFWTKSETILANNATAKKFFNQIDLESGGSLLLSSSFEHLIHHTMIGIKFIKANLEKSSIVDLNNQNNSR
ncbi:transmembrane protein 41A-A-like [Sarcoptes scabiei]|nr:transmembrane protein 41A-A-like [Sarcoptes scabiei]